MFTIAIIFHFIVSIFLISVILLQAGRGGGLSDTFGGGQVESFLGTSGAQFLQKLTSFAAIAFLITCLLLAILSGQKRRSIVIGSDAVNQTAQTTNAQNVSQMAGDADLPLENGQTLPIDSE